MVPPKHILLRAPKSPFEVVTPEQTLRSNLIGDNAGNLVFLTAAYKILATSDATVHVDGLAAESIGAARINAEYDAYVVPLANAFRLSYRRNLEALTRVIRGLRIPVVVLGVGAQLEPSLDPAHLAPMEREIRSFMAAVLDRGPSVGVRGEVSADYLSGLGFRDVEVIGCPSMFLRGDRLEIDRPAGAITGDSSVAITVSPYVGAMAPIVDTHLERYPRLRYIAQDLSTLETLLWGDAEEPTGPPPALPVRSDHPLFRRRRVEMFVDPWPWIRSLRDVDISFGSRIHGAIATLLAGRPAIVLTHDSRTLELARYHAIPHRPLAGLEPGVDVADLYESADLGPLIDGHPARFRTFADYLARHGLRHVFEPGEDPDAFDRRMDAVAFPPAVTYRPVERIGPAGRRLRRLSGRMWRVATRRLRD